MPLIMTALLLAPALAPMVPPLLNTAPPLVMVRLLSEPVLPTVRFRLLQTEPPPLTSDVELLSKTALPLVSTLPLRIFSVP